MASTKKGISSGWFVSPIDLDESTIPPAELANIPQIFDANPAWFFNWNTTTPDFLYKALQAKGIDFTPCVWNSDYKIADALAQNAAPKYVLGFNEPDQSGQANMTTSEVIDAWGKLADETPKDSILVGPAMSDGAWDFMDAVYEGIKSAGYRLDAIGYHCYRTDMNGFGFSNSQRSIPWMADKYGVPVVVSECGYTQWGLEFPYNATDMANTVLAETVKFWENCESSADVARYCAFFSSGAITRNDTSFSWLARVGSCYSELFREYAQI